MRRTLNEIFNDPTSVKLRVKWKKCEPFPDHNPGPGGIRRPVTDFHRDNYVEMWVESILSYIGQKEVEGSVWVIGGDGRFYFNETFRRTVNVVAAHKVKKIVTAQDGLLTTPAMSLLIQKERALGGFLITASHMPAGPEGFIGIKYSVRNGSSAMDSHLEKIFECSKDLKGYSYVPELNFEIDEVRPYGFQINGGYMTVIVCNATKIYADYMETIFDYDNIKKLLFGKSGRNCEFSLLIDCMSSCSGPYVLEIFERRLGLSIRNIINYIPLAEFEKGDPSPRNSKALIQSMRGGRYDAGFGLDCDGDRIMVLGRKATPVSSGDSLAVLAAHLHCIPFFQIRGIKGVARSLSTSTAIDRVAKNLHIPLFEVPVGLQFFTSLLEADFISFFGDESYGVGSSHLPEKDGIWGILAWLSVLYHMKMPIHELLLYHWTKYGRSFSIRMDYDGVEESNGLAMLDAMEHSLLDPSFFGAVLGEPPFTYVVQVAENFMYVDPTEQGLTEKSGVKITFECGSRIVCRLSATRVNRFRLYLEHYSKDVNNFRQDAVATVLPLFRIATELTKVKKYIGTTRPTSIT